MKTKIPTQKSLLATLVAAFLGSLVMPTSGLANEADILRKIEALQAELKLLKAKVEALPVASTGAPTVSAGKVAASSSTDGIAIYGRLDLTAESNNDGTVSRQAMQNMGSRLGFKATRKLGENLTAIGQLETVVAPDDSVNSSAFAGRNSYVGIEHTTMGSIIAGKHDMPFKSLGGTASQLWGNAEAMEIIIHGRGSAQAATAFNHLHTRQTNVFQYWSPKFNNISLKLAYSPDETNTSESTRKSVHGGSVEFNDGKWNLGLATETQRNKFAPNQDMTGLKATAGMKFKLGAVGMAYSVLDNDAGRKTHNWLLTGSHQLGPLVLKANYGESSETASNADDAVKMLGAELDYPLDKFTTLYTYYSKITNAASGKGRFEAGGNTYSPAAGKDPHVLGLGLRYNF